MSRARNDRNLIRFGPKPASLESEIRRVRREIDAETFELRQDIGEGGGGGVTPPPSPVLPPNFNDVIQPGFPFLINSLGSDVSASIYASTTRTRVIRDVGSFASSGGFLITGFNNVYAVDFPSGLTTTIPMTGLGIIGPDSDFFDSPFTIDGRFRGNAVAVDGKIFCQNIDANSLGVRYNSADGSYTAIPRVQPTNQELSDAHFAQYGATPSVTQRNFPTNLFLSQGMLRSGGVSYTISGSGNSSREMWHPGVYTIEPDTLSVSYFQGTRQIFDRVPSPDVGVNLGWNPYLWTSNLSYGNESRFFGQDGGVYRADTLSLSNIPPGTGVSSDQINSGFVDGAGGLVYMRYNGTSGLWEIARISSLGTVQAIPNIFSGDPTDQPINALYRQPGVCPGPNGGYFIYGGVGVDFGISGIGATSIPAIWYTNGSVTGRVWTLPDTPENPLPILAATAQTGHAAQGVSFGDRAKYALNCAVTDMKYDASTGEAEFLVRVGSFANSFFSAIHNQQSWLYRVTL